jgi:hypothetical protein
MQINTKNTFTLDRNSAPFVLAGVVRCPRPLFGCTAAGSSGGGGGSGARLVCVDKQGSTDGIHNGGIVNAASGAGAALRASPPWAQRQTRPDIPAATVRADAGRQRADSIPDQLEIWASGGLSKHADAAHKAAAAAPKQISGSFAVGPRRAAD